MASRNGTIPDVDALGNRERAKQVYGMLRGAQFQLAQLEAMQLVQEFGDDDNVPNQPDVTFAQERANVERQIERITAKYAHLMPAVDSIARREERLQEEEEERFDNLSAEERAAERQR